MSGRFVARPAQRPGDARLARCSIKELLLSLYSRKEGKLFVAGVQFREALDGAAMIGFVRFETEEVFAKLFRGHGGSSAPHERVENNFEVVPSQNFFN